VRAPSRTERRCSRELRATLPVYTYGQVEPLVLLNLITSEVAEDRYFRVSFPGNRPRDSAASAYFICVRGPTLFTTLLCPFVCLMSSRLSSLLRFAFLHILVLMSRASNTILSASISRAMQVKYICVHVLILKIYIL